MVSKVEEVRLSPIWLNIVWPLRFHCSLSSDVLCCWQDFYHRDTTSFGTKAFIHILGQTNKPKSILAILNKMHLCWITATVRRSLLQVHKLRFHLCISEPSKSLPVIPTVFGVSLIQSQKCRKHSLMWRSYGAKLPPLSPFLLNGQ